MTGARRGEPAFSTLVEALRHWASREPDRPAYTFLSDGGAVETTLGWRAVDERVRALAAALQAAGRPGERVLLLFPPGLDFVLAFFACLYSGMVAVPAYPPRLGRAGERERPDLRLRAILADARPGLALTTSAVLSRLAAARAESPELGGLRWLSVEDVPASGASAWTDPGIGPAELAFLQYTSGSTSTPKGVMVSHGNLVHNEEMIRCAYGHTRDLVQLGWLPLYHDMGLIGNVLQPLYTGGRCVLMAPVEFLQRPLSWLQAITRFRATTSGAPNFAYDLCVRKIPPERREGLDLSSWDVAFNGAEPVRAATLERFAGAFAPWGFRRDAFCPCYGLAEATLLVTGGRWGDSPRVAVLDESDLEAVRAVAQEREPGSTRQLVSSGRLWLEERVVIADPATRARRPEGGVGEIWVSSPSVAGGYWNRPEETAETFGALLEGEENAGPFLRTGDLGFLLDGELFVTGRLKDLIILRGRNLYPQDVELTAESAHPALRSGCGAAFPVDVDGEERLVLVQELDRRQERAEVWEEAAAAIRQAVAGEHEVPVHEVVLIRAGTIPKTTSGKIQRHACRIGYLAGTLTVIGRSALAGEAEEGAAPALDREALLARPAGEERRAAVEAALRASIARLLRLPAAALEPARALTSLGLDSLSAVELAHEVESALDAELSLADLLGGATLGGVAGEVVAQLGRETAPSRQLPQEGPETGLRPCTYGQRGLWFLHRLEPGSAAYNLAGAARVRGELGAELLERSFLALVARHELLRSTFEEAGGEPMLRISAEAALDFRAEEASDEEETALLARLAEDGYAPFDLGRGPLLRVRFVSRSPREHVLLLAVHHAVADFWSLAVLLRELGALVAGGGEAMLAPLPLRPADWAARERRRLDGPEGERALAFWREVLGDDPPVLDLPADRPRPAVPQHRGGLCRLRLDTGLAERLAAFGRQRGATLFMTLLAGLQALLQRSSGQRDLAVGTPVAGRTSHELRPLVGYFVQVLVLRSEVDGRQPFVGILDRARQTALAAFAHGEVPLPFLTERLRPSRGGRSPFFQVMLAFQQAHGQGEEALAAFAVREPGARLVLGGLDLECLPLAPGEAQHDLVLHVAETGGGLAAALEYDADLFDGTTAARLLEHLHQLLAGVVAAPGRPVAEIPLLAEAEQAQMLIEWNDTAAGVPEGPCLHELFEAQVRRTPAAEALVAGETRWTYEELSRRANRLAHFLRRLGVAPEERVGVCLGRSARLVESLFAVLKAGGAYVPLDPAYPAERLDFLVGDAAARVVLTEGPDLAVRLGASGARVVDLAAEEEWIAAQPSVDPKPLAGPGHLAYLIYTSGSTGRPKGVAIEHRSPVALAFWAREVLTPEELSGVLASTSAGFDLSIFEIFVPLAWGGRVILAENALALPSLAAAGEVRLINTVPSAMAELVRGVLPAGPFTVCLAGEPIGAALAAALAADRRIRRSFNLYGPSEDTTYSTFARLDPGEAGSPPIGRPVAETRVYLLDPEGRPVPIGVPGELCLAGAGLARGYLDRPDLTAERFVPDPFSRQPGRRLYRTGDLARFRAGGVLDFLGRRDHQVKVRGFRIELGEIESALVVRPEIHEAAAMACEASPGDVRLVAWVVPAPGAEPTPAELRALLERTLPRHAVPSAFVVLDALPRTPHGKVDRRRLPQPSWEVGRAEEEVPRTPVEELLAGIWCDLLGAPRIGRGASFFELGGHSLLATRMLSRVREALGVDLPFSTVFAAPTLARLAEAVEAARSEPASALPEPPLAPAGIAGPRPLSFAQERLWFLDQLEPGLPVYNVPGALRWRQALDVAALERAFGEIVRRHEILRTRLESLGDRPVQVVQPPGAQPLPLIDLSGLEGPLREAEARRLTTVEARRPFDLENGPLFRTAVLRLDPNDHLVSATLHHIASDGWSLSILLREVAVLYEAFAGGRPSPLPELPLQYSDFAVWQRAWLDGEVLERQLDFWRTRLDGAPPALELPADRPRPPVQSFRGSDLRIELPAELTAALRALGHREGATLFMTLLAGFQALLHVYSGQDDVLVGTPLANRGRAEIEGVIGFFVNALVIRTDLAENPELRALVGQVRQNVLDVHAHQDLPLEKLVEELQIERDLSRTPLFQVVFALQTAAVRLPEIPGLALAFEPVPTGTSKFDLMLDLTDGPEGVAGYFEHATDLFDAVTVQRMSGHLLALLRGAAERPDLRVRDLPLLGEAERHQLLAESNDTILEHAAEGCVHELFERWAQRTPDAVAVVGQDRSLTYRDVERQANRLARHLARLGVGPEAPVALCLDRSPELVVGMLGILKAGGAYVPIDPAAPEQRAAFMLQDCAARALVTDERLAERLAVEGLAVVRLDADAERLAVESEARPVPAAEGGHLAYVIYTSGSTGMPKGVGVEHRQLLNYLQGVRRRLDLEGVGSYASVSTFAADLGHTVIFPALCGGGCLHLIAPERASDPQALGDYFERHGIDCLKLVPSHLEALLDGPRPGAVLPRRRLVLGGEAASRELLEKLSRADATCRLFNHYGPTETTVGVITHPVPLDGGTAGRRLPLGRPIPNVQIHVLGPDLEPAPLGVPGELYIGGASVARGYLGRPALTAERFVPDPFASEAGARLYRTGDRARRLPAGELLFLGRMDDQLKFHGYRIEPNEIRSALNRHAKVRDSVILLKKDPHGRDALVAYYVSRQEIDPEELRDFLSSSVIEETIPNLFVHLKKLPLTLNGKVNFQALPGLDEIRGKAQQELVPPRTPAEEALARIWRDVLGIDRVGIHDNFFQLGGHSLLATRVLSRIREAFGVSPPLRTLFEKPTIARLALAITQLQADLESDDEMARLIQELSGMSGEELQQALDAENRLHDEESHL